MLNNLEIELKKEKKLLKSKVGDQISKKLISVEAAWGKNNIDQSKITGIKKEVSKYGYIKYFCHDSQ